MHVHIYITSVWIHMWTTFIKYIFPVTGLVKCPATAYWFSGGYRACLGFSINRPLLRIWPPTNNPLFLENREMCYFMYIYMMLWY